ncbi:MAG: polyprenyl synthetase family protein [Candidatus Omnitrophota bacterium]
MKTEETIQAIYGPIADDLRKVPEAILSILDSSNPLIGDVVRHFFAGQGKLLRPALTFLGARMAGGSVDGKLVAMASAVEIFHVATLIHDDIIDDSKVRRNLPTVHTKWDAKTAVMIGDFFQDRAVITLYENSGPEIHRRFWKVAETVCEGEIHEWREKNNLCLSEEDYLEIIRKKTAVLLAYCLESGAVACGAERAASEKLLQFGLKLGMAFQIVDDCLDFEGDAEAFGKNPGTDFLGGVMTLPVIELLHSLDGTRKAGIGRLWRSGTSDPHGLRTLIGLMREHGALERAYGKARAFGEEARALLKGFPESPYRSSLFRLLDHVIERKR